MAPNRLKTSRSGFPPAARPGLMVPIPISLLAFQFSVSFALNFLRFWYLDLGVFSRVFAMWGVWLGFCGDGDTTFFFSFPFFWSWGE
jgi:hypothetical protein